MIRTRKSASRRAKTACTGTIVLVVTGACSTPAFSAEKQCQLGQVAELPVTMQGLRPLVPAGINGTPVQFVLDSGAFFSTINPAVAADLQLKMRAAPINSIVGIAHGQAEVSMATVKTLTLERFAAKNVDFLVGGNDTGGGTTGLLGRNVFLDSWDVEFDLGNGVVRLIKPTDCRDRPLAYWAVASTPYSEIALDAPTGADREILAHASVNGVEIRIMFDTGAPTSFLSLHAAARAGIKLDAPGVISGGTTHGVGQASIPTYIAPVADFKIGEEEIKNTKLRLGDIALPDAAMLIGADFFLSHRIYVANSQHKLYFTYNGGPVFNLAVWHPANESAPVQPAQPSSTQPAPTQASAASGEDAVHAASDLARRGSAAASRGDYASAIADLSQACELAPGVPDYWYQRALVYQDNNRADLALNDFDRTLQLRPKDARALLLRASLLIGRGETTRANADLDAADAAASKESDLRLEMANADVEADLLDAAIKQYGLWIESHGADARLPDGLNGRCWARALQGKELPLALKDCDSAARAVLKPSAEFSKILNSRALVLLRMGDYGKSIADYDASLKINPKSASGWYGRGIDELRLNKTSEAQANIERAKSLSAQVSDEYSQHGISP